MRGDPGEADDRCLRVTPSGTTVTAVAATATCWANVPLRALRAMPGMIAATRSPTEMRSTVLPTAVTVPTRSRPSTTGNSWGIMSQT